MKILKYLLYVLLALVAIVVVLGLVGPKTYDVSRTAVIAASPEQVWPYVSSLQKHYDWTPWAKRDSTTVIEYSGTEGTVGSMSKWTGNESGQGQQTITALDPNKSVETRIEFIKPWESTTDGYITLQDTAGQTKVVWGMRGANGFVSRIIASLMSMDKMIGKDFEEGLANLQALAPQMTAGAAPSHTVTPGEFPGAKYLGVRSTIGMDQMEKFYSDNLGKVYGELQKGGVEVAGSACGLYYVWDMEKNTTDVAAAFRFNGDLKKVPDGMAVLEVPAAKSLTVDHMGGYSGLYGAHTAMDNYIKANKLEHFAPVIEEYVTDPGAEPDSTKWLTRIIYLVK